ncbi:MAG: DUF512 domain-containing protein, partial [Fidelibacterota bacterium]
GMAIEENGVGQVRAFLDRFKKEQKKLPHSLDSPTRFTIATGVLAAGIFDDHILPRLNSIRNLTVTLEVVHNTLFGAPVTVAGLLPGKAFVEQLSGKELGSAVWTTRRILNDSGELTLDDMTPVQIGEQLGVSFHVADDSMLDLVQGGLHG